MRHIVAVLGVDHYLAGMIQTSILGEGSESMGESEGVVQIG